MRSYYCINQEEHVTNNLSFVTSYNEEWINQLISEWEEIGELPEILDRFKNFIQSM